MTKAIPAGMGQGWTEMKDTDPTGTTGDRHRATKGHKAVALEAIEVCKTIL